MSTNQSRRASGRKRELRGYVLGALRAHTPLTTLLERDDSVAAGEGASAIVPAPMLDIQHRSDTTDAPDVACAVGVVTTSSERENRQERVRLAIQTDFQLRERAMRDHGVPWVDEIDDELAAVLTAHSEGWHAQGATGGTPEPLWDDSLNRYRSVQRFDINSWG